MASAAKPDSSGTTQPTKSNPSAATPAAKPNSDQQKAQSTAQKKTTTTTVAQKNPPIGVISPVNVVFTNRGDVTIHDIVATFSTNVSSLVGTALTATTYPLGIIGQTTFHLFTLRPYSSQTETLMIRSAVYCSALAPLNVVCAQSLRKRMISAPP